MSSVDIEINRSAIKGRITGAVAGMMYPLSEQVLADCNQFVRVDQGQLRQSSYTASNLSSGEVVWNTPYAKRVYYTGTPARDVNPSASLRWCEKARAKYGKDWNKIAQKLFERGMGK